MKSRILLFSILSFLLSTSYGQQTVGLFTNTSTSFDGYTLFGPQDSEETFLINNCGEKVHSWTSAYKPGLSSYLLENGNLLHTGRITGMGGGSGVIEILDWNSTVLWSHSVTASHGRQHHDVELLPNGNILLIVWDKRTQSEVSKAGSSTSNSFINSEQIVEIKPDLVNGGASIVWEWKAWDHLIQDNDAGQDNFGTVGDHPEKIDVNFLTHNKTDWLHINGIDYNENLDQIILSIHNFSEFWIIDHSTSTSEAANSSGGTSNKGGDLLYRWGNPQAYQQGNATDQKLFLQHHTHWIPEGYPDAGKIIAFNNQAGILSNYSTVNIIDVPLEQNGTYTYSGGDFAPLDFDWIYQAPVPEDFYSNIISGAERLANGNTLICQGVTGRFFEIDANKNIVWEYINPVTETEIVPQYNDPTGNSVFRCVRYPLDYAGFDNKTLTPQGYLEAGSTIDCSTFPVSVAEIERNSSLAKLIQNPVSHQINISIASEKLEPFLLEIHSISGQLIHQQVLQLKTQDIQLSTSFFENGIYLLTIRTSSQYWNQKLIVSK